MLFEQEFESMLQQYKSDIDDKRKFTGLVKDFFPEQAKNVNLLLMAYNMGIAEDLTKTSQINNTFVFIVKYNYRKLQMRIGECCISKLEKVAKHSLKTLRNGVAPEW